MTTSAVCKYCVARAIRQISADVARDEAAQGGAGGYPLATAVGTAVAGGRVVATRAATIRRAARLLAEKWRA